MFLQHVSVYFLTYSECRSEVEMLPNCLLFFVTFSAKPTTCRGNDAARMSAAAAAEMACSVCSCFSGLVMVLRLFTGSSIHLLGESR